MTFKSRRRPEACASSFSGKQTRPRRAAPCFGPGSLSFDRQGRATAGLMRLAAQRAVAESVHADPHKIVRSFALSVAYFELWGKLGDGMKRAA
jgi:hypothetical protein